MYNRNDRKKFAPISAKIPHMIHGGDGLFKGLLRAVARGEAVIAQIAPAYV